MSGSPADTRELVTICTNQYFDAHRSIQVWRQGLPLAQQRFSGTYDRLGPGVNMTFNADDLARGGAFTSYVSQYIAGNAGVGVRVLGPFTIPGEVPGDRIGPLAPPPWSEEVFADPDYNLVDNNCITTVAEVLNKVRLRFIRAGVPRRAVRMFRPFIILRKAWIFPAPGQPVPPVPPAFVRDVQLLRNVLNDPNAPPQELQRRREMAMDSFVDGEFATYYTPYRLDEQLAAAMLVWKGRAGLP